MLGGSFFVISTKGHPRWPLQRLESTGSPAVYRLLENLEYELTGIEGHGDDVRASTYSIFYIQITVFITTFITEIIIRSLLIRQSVFGDYHMFITYSGLGLVSIRRLSQLNILDKLDIVITSSANFFDTTIDVNHLGSTK
ncbi:hypothetical protein L6452_38515 [Arctium lappa]|uniref:Uncharacterized protein n=1 Tax=Arctium lappa TaxID=4217 RepID=A0ACB8XPC7_ARCLA|nr:hypothetical protein L6452_38515 [Arctium lappa]